VVDACAPEAARDELATLAGSDHRARFFGKNENTPAAAASEAVAVEAGVDVTAGKLSPVCK